MEGTRRESERIVVVERQFEWSRLESQLMSTAYERVAPVLRFVIGEPAGVEDSLLSADRVAACASRSHRPQEPDR